MINCACGALSPVKATEDMTVPVGERNGQLFVKSEGTQLPDPSTLETGTTMQVENGEWTPSTEIRDKTVENESRFESISDDYDDLSEQIEQIVSDLSSKIADFDETLGIDETTLSEILRSVTTARDTIKAAANEMFENIGTEISDDDAFGAKTYIIGGVPFYTSKYATRITNAYESLITKIENTLNETSSAVYPIDSLISKIEYAMDDLRAAINNIISGDNRITEETPLTDYADYIPSAINPLVLDMDATGSVSDAYINELTIPTSGSTYTFDPSQLNSDNKGAVFSAAKKITISEQYTRIVKLPHAPASTHIHLEAIDILGTGTASKDCFEHTSSILRKSTVLRTVNMPHITKMIETDNTLTMFVGGGTGELPITINIPDFIGAVRFYTLGSSANKGLTGIPCTIHAESATAVGTTPSYPSVNGSYVKGTYYFDSALTIVGINNLPYRSIFYLPSLAEFGRYNGTPDWSGDIDFYIGPNMHTIHSDTAALIDDQFFNITIHIPAGDSTTKTTLDNAGITNYVQDYDI